MIARALMIHGTFFSPIVSMAPLGDANKTEDISQMGEMPSKHINR